MSIQPNRANRRNGQAKIKIALNKTVALTVVATMTLIGVIYYAKQLKIKQASNPGKDIQEAIAFDIGFATAGDILDNVYRIVEKEYSHIQTKLNPTKHDKILAIKQAGLLDELGIFGPYNDNVIISREMALNLVTQIVRDTNKNNVPQEFVSSLSDFDKYEDREIEFFDYNQILSNEAGYYHGIASAEREELKAGLDKLENILEQTEPIKILQLDKSDEIETTKPQKEVLPVTREVFEDNLFGESVAVYTEPKNTTELDINIEQLFIGDAYSDKNNYTFINADEGLLDYTETKAQSSKEITEEARARMEYETRLQSIVRCDMPNGVVVYKDEKGMVWLEHDNFSNMGTGLYGTETVAFMQAYLVSNNKVTSDIWMVIDQYGHTSFRMSEESFKEAEYLMPVTYKDILLGDNRYIDQNAVVGILFDISKLKDKL